MKQLTPNIEYIRCGILARFHYCIIRLNRWDLSTASRYTLLIYLN